MSLFACRPPFCLWPTRKSPQLVTQAVAPRARSRAWVAVALLVLVLAMMPLLAIVWVVSKLRKSR